VEGKAEVQKQKRRGWAGGETREDEGIGEKKPGKEPKDKKEKLARARESDMKRKKTIP